MADLGSFNKQKIIDTAVAQFMRCYEDLDGRQTDGESFAWRAAIRSMMVGLGLYSEFTDALPDERPDNPKRYFAATSPESDPSNGPDL
jgi:hypothetical protein